MKLTYCKINNFGDAINPLVFNTLLPDFFDDKEDIGFIGIGSLLGLDPLLKAQKKIIFSTGFAYGYPAIVDDTYDIVCVRGPLTARAIGVNENLAIADGAILLKSIVSPPTTKIYEASLMLHWESDTKFSWDRLCKTLNINHISPQEDINVVIEKIGASKMLVTEAMHGAIVADALRVPWIPIRAYRYINTLKWKDWLAAMNMRYDCKYIPSLYEDSLFAGNTASNLMDRFGIKDIARMSKCFRAIQQWILLPIAIGRIRSICKSNPYLSTDSILDSKVDKLLSLLQYVYKKYR